MKKFKFLTDNDAVMRLNNSVVKHNGIPVYITSAAKRNCMCIDLTTGEDIVVPTKDLDLMPVSIGNIQVGNSFIYCQRMPTRRFKQGLSSENLQSKDTPWVVQNVRNILKSKNIADTILNNFDSVSYAIDKVIKDRTHVSVAFSLRWGIGMVKGVPRLFYKGDEVGVFDNGDIHLFRKYVFLKEDLLDVLNKRG